MNEPKMAEGEGGRIGQGQMAARLGQPGNRSRHERICRELAPVCDAIDQADFLGGVEVERFLRLADGAGRG